MQRLKKLFVVLFAILAFSTEIFAQVTATATANATIITPIAIAWGADMNFGNVASSVLAGTVVLTPLGGRSTTGGVTLPATTGTVSAASFTVTGEAAFTYAITLPAGATTISSGGNNMTVNTWTSNPSGTGTLTGGTSTLRVGATLNVGISQPAGTYVSGIPFTVQVNYN